MRLVGEGGGLGLAGMTQAVNSLFGRILRQDSKSMTLHAPNRITEAYAVQLIAMPFESKDYCGAPFFAPPQGHACQARHGQHVWCVAVVLGSARTRSLTFSSLPHTHVGMRLEFYAGRGSCPLPVASSLFGLALYARSAHATWDAWAEEDRGRPGPGQGM